MIFYNYGFSCFAKTGSELKCQLMVICNGNGEYTPVSIRIIYIVTAVKTGTAGSSFFSCIFCLVKSGNDAPILKSFVLLLKFPDENNVSRVFPQILNISRTWHTKRKSNLHVNTCSTMFISKNSIHIFYRQSSQDNHEWHLWSRL